MVSKIEAAERMAEAISEFTSKTIDCSDVGQIKRHAMNMHAAMSAYRSASVPSDEELGRVLYKALSSSIGVTRYDQAAAAVRDWLQRDGLTGEEREAVVALVDCHLANAELRASILRKLGREPKPVWEWDEEYGTLCLYSPERVSLAEVSLTENGLQATVFPTKQHTNGSAWTVVDAKEWCEQQLREARQ